MALPIISLAIRLINKVGEALVANESFKMVSKVFCRMTLLIAHCAQCGMTPPTSTKSLKCDVSDGLTE